MNTLRNTPFGSSQNAPIEVLGQCSRRYVRAKEIKNLASNKYQKNGRGITFSDLLSNGLATSKLQAQTTLKYSIRKGILFTASNRKPQEYYPSSLRSEILKARISRNIPINPTGVDNNCNRRSSPLGHDYDSIIIQTLEGHVLPMLPKAPLFIHNMHFKLKISPECHHELNIPTWNGNHGKHYPDVIGKVRADYVFYANGTVDVYTQSSQNPHRLETETDRGRLMAFFGQIRDRLVTFLMDKHERIVPEIMKWELTECDINKDIKVSDSLHLCGLKIQVRHLDHLFSVYIKSMKEDTVCRVEERKSLKHIPAIEFIDKILNPIENIENHSLLEGKIDQIILAIEQLKFVRIFGYCYGDRFAIY